MAHAPDRLVPAGEVTTLRIGFENWFAPGRYFAAVASRAGSGQTY